MFWCALLGCLQSCDHALRHEKFWVLLDMMGGALMFGPVVGQFCCAGPPEETELALGSHGISASEIACPSLWFALAECCI
jgi:hypothetical protein